MIVNAGIAQFQFEAFFLIFARFIAFLSVAPIFSRKGIPNIVKIALALFLSIIIVGIAPAPAANTSNSILMFALLIVNESILGLALGYLATLMFAIIGMGGQFIDFQMGLSIGAIYDPGTQTQSTLFGSLYNWMALMLLLAINGHHYMLKAVAESFRILPVGTVDMSKYNAEGIVHLFTDSIGIAFQIAVPVLIVLILTDIILGIIARTVPQLQIFLLSIPIKIMLGILFLIAMASVTFGRVGTILSEIPKVTIEALSSFM